MNLPNQIFSGSFHGGHVQGIAVDSLRGFVYYSFTTVLIKTDLQGRLLGSVTNLIGHLGCITLDAERNLLYGSLEYKHDAIGQGISKSLGIDLSYDEGFYLVCFDLEKIDREHMNAEQDGVMKAVYLRTVLEDYLATDEVSGKPHRYGCAGVDGTALGPVFGAEPTSPKKIMVACGIYRDTERQDNDHQLILQYDRSIFDEFGQPLIQSAPHHSGPATCEQRYFFYTGNTTYGVQNLEYDPHSRNWAVAVYVGTKECYTNFPLFMIDGSIAPKHTKLIGRNGEEGLRLSCARVGELGKDGEIYGSHFPYGDTGIAALGDGTFYFSHHGRNKEEKTYCTTLVRYRYCPENPMLFEPIE